MTALVFLWEVLDKTTVPKKPYRSCLNLFGNVFRGGFVSTNLSLQFSCEEVLSEVVRRLSLNFGSSTLVVGHQVAGVLLGVGVSISGLLRHKRH